MKKLITTLFCSFLGGSLFAQWAPTTFTGGKDKASNVRSYYKLDLDKIRTQLKDAQETGKNAKPVEISLPTLDGKIEKFAVYSFPVLDKALADQYQLGSYVGVGINDPSKYVRFSVAPNDFQSMIIKNGEYEFINPVDAGKTTYGVHPKTEKGNGGFTCSTSESKKSKEEIKKLLDMGKTFSNQATNFAKSSDKKYRTMRLAMSVTGEYTQFFGGTVAGALAAINATMTRVNGVFEKDLALHLNVQNYPGIIYTDPATDPYTNDLNLQLQQTLTANVGDANYDIGHVFNAAGNNGNAGCIGCVCIAPTTTVPQGKGSAFTQTANPQGDAFDIDFVAHEMGHQLGANHTFAFAIEGTGVNMEPGSGSTIMGYAGIVPGANVQMNSDPYFHVASIEQVQTNLNSKTCDIETNITNNPPVIAPLPDYTIPNGTAFVLTGTATDAENDPMTYTWEQSDSATSPVTTVTGNNTTGPLFRSWNPSATGNTRYFPKLSSVLAGNLTVPADWETVSNVARETDFVLTVRDNNPVATAQQTQSDLVTVTVGNDGPFKVTTQYANINTPTPIQWAVANTAAAPYNVANVKIDYTTDNGTTWTVLSASTPNDGSENFTFPSSMNGQTIKLRVSSIGNIFYAVAPVNVTTFQACDGSAPTAVTTSNITSNSVYVSWVPVSGATYIIRYKKTSATTWQQTTSTSADVTISGLDDSTAYEVQVAAVCSGTPGAYSASVNFTTAGITYCTLESEDSNYEYISNVTLANVNNNSMASTYTNYTTDPTKVVNLVNNSTNNVISVSKSWVSTLYNEAVRVWIDFNRNGTFEASELVMDSPLSKTTPVTATFAVPSTAVLNKALRMRVVMSDSSSPPACGTFSYGEVEDYNVMISDVLATNDLNGPKNDIQLYPNPVSDILNVTKVSDKAAYKIYSAAGQLVESGNINGGKINVSGLIKGGYVITIEDKGKDLFKSKFIKK